MFLVSLVYDEEDSEQTPFTVLSCFVILDFTKAFCSLGVKFSCIEDTFMYTFLSHFFPCFLKRCVKVY